MKHRFPLLIIAAAIGSTLLQGNSPVRADDAPAPLTAGKVVDYNVSLGVTAKHDEIRFKRTFSFSGLVFPVSNYPQLKQVFDSIHERDNHTITLKLAAAVQ